MEWLTEDLKKIIVENGNQYRIDPVLIAAIIATESNGDPYAVRYEPNFIYSYQVNKHALLNRISVSTEHVCQKMSFGLVQIMGCVARELGFTDNLLKLTDPELSVKYGCKKLRELFDIYKLESDVISAYNCGSVKKKGGPYTNPHYVEKVLNFKKELSFCF